MELAVGDKIRAFVKRNDTGIEITTKILKISDSSLLVEWEGGNGGSWWISSNLNRPPNHCGGGGKIICKNWKRFEK